MRTPGAVAQLPARNGAGRSPGSGAQARRDLRAGGDARRPVDRRDTEVASRLRSPGWRAITALVLSLAGFGDSMYLTIEHYTGNGSLICSATSVVNCLKVTTSPESMVFGAPVALLGLIFFTAMIGINLPVLWRSGPKWIPWLRLAMVVGSMGFVIYLLYSELFSIKAICLWCTGVHVITFLLFVLVVSSLPAFSDPAGAA